MKSKGVCYDVGRVLEGTLQRPTFDLNVVRQELEIIKNDLHCNAVRIQGLDIERLTAASEEASKLGLSIWFSPEMFEKDQQETFEYLTKAAEAAESLRQKYPDLIFSLGSELMLFMQGILEGNNLFERMNSPSFRQNVKDVRTSEKLNAFLSKANRSVREIFHGQVTYFSVPWERVDWKDLDYVGIDLYRDTRMGDIYERWLGSSLAHSKPVVIGEFGCCTYQGAEKLGGMGWILGLELAREQLGQNVTLPQGLEVYMDSYIKVIPKVDGHFVRDESLQAREIVDQLGVLDRAGVYGTFVFTFVSPLSHYNEDPRYDSDLPSYSLVRSYPDRESLETVIRQTTRQVKQVLGIELPRGLSERFAANIGKHGITYPDMIWEPKESFRAIADYYSKN